MLMKNPAPAHKLGSDALKTSTFGRLRAPLLGAIALAMAVAAPNAGAKAQSQPQPQPQSQLQPHGETAITCTNPFSGATWQIKIDYDRRTVDANPADMTDSTISWRDAANGWKYELDRKTGKLRVTLASATGGNFLYDQCKLAN
jgi:hypothetical protein